MFQIAFIQNQIIKKVEKSKVRWALGSDIGGGPFLSMFDVMRSFVEQNKLKGVKGASFVKSLYRSTLAGAEILGVSKVSGNLNKGKEASFIVIPFHLDQPPKDPESLLKSIIGPLKNKREQYGDCVKSVYLNGKLS
jgi:guanine deaminase